MCYQTNNYLSWIGLKTSGDMVCEMISKKRLAPVIRVNISFIPFYIFYVVNHAVAELFPSLALLHGSELAKPILRLACVLVISGMK